jgi:tetratricopeptide (TPR) repeat protein
MPMTINGIGTQYYGRKNPRVYSGVCDSCQGNGTLTDYETGHYFVVVFIPVIPLGRKQIIAECSSCRCHRDMPLRQWEQMREESLNSGLEQLGDSMDDPEKAIELLYNMTLFNQLDEAMELAAVAAKQHAQDFNTMVNIGSWYEQQNQPELASNCFSAAINLNPEHPSSKRIQGIQAIEDANPIAAAQHFESLRLAVASYDPSLFCMLAICYQDQSMHEKAIEEFKDIIQRTPDITKDKSFRKAVKISEKAAGSPTTILPKAGLFG